MRTTKHPNPESVVDKITLDEYLDKIQDKERVQIRIEVRGSEPVTSPYASKAIDRIRHLKGEVLGSNWVYTDPGGQRVTACLDPR